MGVKRVEEQEKPNYYAVIISEVRYDKRISSTAKLIYGEITALSNKTGVCWASNKYFSDNFGISQSQVSRVISKLEELNYIHSVVEDNYKRQITIKPIPLRKNRKGDTQKPQTPPTQKCVYNNTSINNKYNTSKWYKKLVKCVEESIPNIDNPNAYLNSLVSKYGVSLVERLFKKDIPSSDWTKHLKEWETLDKPTK